MCGDKKQLFMTVSSPRNAFWRYSGRPELNHCRVSMPRARHPRTKNQVNECVGTINRMAGCAQCIDNLSTIQCDFKPLKSKTFTCTLRSHNYSEVSERKVYTGKVRKIFDLKGYRAALPAITGRLGQVTTPLAAGSRYSIKQPPFGSPRSESASFGVRLSKPKPSSPKTRIAYIHLTVQSSGAVSSRCLGSTATVASRAPPIPSYPPPASLSPPSAAARRDRTPSPAPRPRPRS